MVSVDTGVEGGGTSRPRRATPSVFMEGNSEVGVEVIEDEALRPPVRRIRDVPRADDARKGKSLVLRMTFVSGDEVRHVVPSPKDEAGSQSLALEIGAHERWTVMDKEPFKVFEAFNLKQDSSYYEEVAREEQVTRCKRRVGRIVSDICRFAEAYVGKSDDSVRDALQRELDSAKQTIAELTGKQEQNEEVRRVKAQIKKAQEEMKDLRASAEMKERRITELSKTLEEHTALWNTGKDALERDVDSALDEGCRLCWNMASNAGVDMSAFTFGEYLSSLNEDGGLG